MNEQRQPGAQLMAPLINGHWPECEPPDEVGARGCCICDGKPRPMTQQELNELICAKLLAWSRCPADDCAGWLPPEPDADHRYGTPSFATWAEAGLILDALRGKGMVVHFFAEQDRFCVESFARDSESARVEFSEAAAHAGPLAIRAAALEYLKASQS